MEFEFTPGIGRDLVFPMIKAGELNFAVTGDWTPATGDTKRSIDSANVADTSNNPVAVGGTGSVLWKLTLSATDLPASAKVVVIQIIDAATKAVEDQSLIGYAKDADKIEIFTVNDASTSPTQTQFEADRGLSRSEEATTDHFKDRTVLFLTGTHQGERVGITGYAQQNSRGFFTVTSLVSPAPADGDVFMIL